MKSIFVASKLKKECAIIFGAIALLSTLGAIAFLSSGLDAGLVDLAKMASFDLPFIIASAAGGFLVGDWYTRDPRGGVLEAISAPIVVYLTAFLVTMLFYSPVMSISDWTDEIGGHIYVAVHAVILVPAAILATTLLRMKHNP